MFTNQNKSSNNKYFMGLALEHAKKNIGNTKLNPSVGCVIVKNNCVIGAGTTSANGRPHAEINAIANARQNIKKSSLYVTLEPCSHYGKTPPCVNKIIKEKFKNIFYSIHDPDLRTFKKSSEILSKKGIKSNSGINSKEIKNFYRSYFLSKEKKQPFITLKLAASKDYKTINKKGSWITNFYSRSRVHLMRAEHDCIITSSNTIIKDNPLLNCRINGLEDRSPVVLILDKNLKTPVNSKIFNSPKNSKVIIFYNKSNVRKIKLMNKNKVKLIKSTLNSNNKLDLTNIILKVKKLGFSRLFLECGEVLATSFLKQNLVNDFKLFISNDKLNNSGSGSIKKYFETFLKKKKYKVEKVNLFGEKLITFKLK
jgi:diaminohydroxyphosphoribosylaminopyrimidine deaminase / 5-amino-6-(5-phosphoribosylamino)uracil reductase